MIISTVGSQRTHNWGEHERAPQYLMRMACQKLSMHQMMKFVMLSNATTILFKRFQIRRSLPTVVITVAIYRRAVQQQPVSSQPLSKLIMQCMHALVQSVQWRHCHRDAASSQLLMSIKVDQCMQSVQLWCSE